MDVTIRAYRQTDAVDLAEVMWRSVREVAVTDYTREQVEAWLPERLSPDTMHMWASSGREVLVATDSGGRVVGYTDLESDGHIDHLYCAPEAVGEGVAAALCDALEALAASEGVRRLQVEASEAARRLFERRGFRVDSRREWELRGVLIHNYVMSKAL